MSGMYLPLHIMHKLYNNLHKMCIKLITIPVQSIMHSRIILPCNNLPGKCYIIVHKLHPTLQSL